MLDIDHFKKINDTYGHAAGDEVLKAVSRVVQKSIRHTDVFARIGGEEFVILAPETGLEHTVDVAGKVRSTIAASLVHHNEKVTISFGVAELGNAATIDEFVRRADSAMYLAKTNGRNRVEYYQETAQENNEPSS